jgi:hypothetical protein
MNEKMVLDWLLEDTRKNAGRWYSPISKLEKALYELNNQQEKSLPPSLPRREADMIRALRKHFNNNVTYISLVLHHHFPDRYLFYRVSSLEQEIFTGFSFLKPAVPQFTFGFSKVGGTGFNRYLELNEALLSFAQANGLGGRSTQKNLTYFLYQGLGRLFQEKPTVHYRRYWVMATKERFFKELDAEEEAVWSGRKEMQAGDLAFVYRTKPVSAITDIYRVKGEPRFNPWGGWRGFWVDVEKVCAIEPISFARMDEDHVLKEWGIVRRNFVGTTAEPVPPIVYNRLLEIIGPDVQAECNLEREPERPPVTSSSPHPATWPTPELSGQFGLEAEFEDKVIRPLLKGWGFKAQGQYTCPAWIGSQELQLRVDYLVSDDQEPLTLFEDKLRIFDDEDLKSAMGQAKSYALLLGLPSFVIASPEGMWLYSLDGNQEKLVEPISQLKVRSQQEQEFRELLLKLGARGTGYQQPRH